MTLEEFHKQQSKHRGRRWFFIICAVCLVVMALCLAACSPALLRIEAPRELKDAPVYVPPGKAPVQAAVSDESINRWLKEQTRFNQLHLIP